MEIKPHRKYRTEARWLGCATVGSLRSAIFVRSPKKSSTTNLATYDCRRSEQNGSKFKFGNPSNSLNLLWRMIVPWTVWRYTSPVHWKPRQTIQCRSLTQDTSYQMHPSEIDPSWILSTSVLQCNGESMQQDCAGSNCNYTVISRRLVLQMGAEIPQSTLCCVTFLSEEIWQNFCMTLCTNKFSPGQHRFHDLNITWPQ